MNNERRLERKRRYRELHREEIRAKGRMYYAQHKWRYRFRALLRDARLASDEKYYAEFRARQRGYMRKFHDKTRQR